MKAGEIRQGMLAMAAAAMLAACGGGANEGDPLPTARAQSSQHSNLNRLPAFVSGPVRTTVYDGASDDLLTAGLGAAGLASAIPPGYVDGTAPTAAELRRAAIYNNYRALVDMTAAGGYGSLYGPTVGPGGTTLPNDGKVAGVEVLAYSDDGGGRRNVTLMVQVPDSFDPDRACIMTATSSGSRGVYGAISAGEWGLKRGCAVAYTDKGTGGAPHDLMADTVSLIDGTRATAAAASSAAHFNAGLDATELAAFNAATPHRFAFKHAHSGRNPEADWGRFTLQAVEFAFWVLNERYSPRTGTGLAVKQIQPRNTLVIASSISNGGGAALAAAELDAQGLIDGVAVTEPAVELPANLGVTVERGGVPVPTIGKPLIDFTTWANVYQPCASLSAQLAGTPFQSTYALPAVFGFVAANRCASLKAKGLLTAETTAAQADEALARLRGYGWEAESDPLHASHAAFEIASAVSVTFANAYARTRVSDHLCGYSFAGIDATAAPAPLAATAVAQMFATGNGVPPNSGVQMINNRSVGGPRRDVASVSPSTLAADMNVDGALCLRNLVTGSDANALALQAGLDATRRSGNLHGKPTLIVHGRSDALLPVNHTSRPYTALNKRVEGQGSRLSYIEVTHAQHFDGFIGLPAVLPGYDTRYVSLHLYLFRALDAMYGHLAQGQALPPSQVVRTVPRGGTPGAAPALTAANVPPIALAPAAGDRIEFSDNTLRIPD
ncbi:D-(-)-3-hydroxybutyrate oligomer hydrolase [Caldimonas sp. KR1-144]|uniref:D-(-)-3-hydroxybutyrate oligomer hydrolase n=1 Tax=Caldimonas sp. KR1-144 TaxID=3400911 RepID=UPI003C0911A0